MAWDFVLTSGPYNSITEGPSWDGTSLLFTHMPSRSIMRYNPQTDTTTVFRTETNRANGLMFDSQSRLYACEGGARRMVRYEADVSTTVLADGFQGNRLNIPNDLAIDLQGRVWFTDPYYTGAGGKWSLDESKNKDLDHDSVYRLDAEGNILATAGAKQSGPGPMIYVFSASGKVREAHPVPGDKPTNCTFGGPDLTTLYVTTGEGHLFEARTQRQGRLLFPLLGQQSVP